MMLVIVFVISNDAVCIIDSAACAPETPIFFPNMFNASLADSGLE